MTVVRLAYGGPPNALRKGLSQEPAPALLVSYYYIKGFLKLRDELVFRDWVMDSGAFSAHNSGKEIDLQEYIDFSLKMQEEDPTLAEVYGLDVIGDHEASLRNVEEMIRQGVNAIPTFHMGSPWEGLTELEKYPKIALGGMVRRSAKLKEKWLEQVFARIWPKRMHAFGIAAEPLLMKYPFHSCDASNWELLPTAFGRWKAYDGALSVKGGEQNLRTEVDWYLKMEQRLQHRWRREMALLSKLETT